MKTTSKHTAGLKQSSIRSASKRCAEINGVNLGQGICDIPIQPKIKQAALSAINADNNLYAPCEGILTLRQAISKKLKKFNKIEANPESEILVTHGSTGAYVCAMHVLFNPGDEIILFEPFYGYHQHISKLHGIEVKSVLIDGNNAVNKAELEAAITPKTKAIVVCTPCNPSGKVFSQQDLITIGDIANQYDMSIITDEIYEYITYPGYEHISIASLKNYAKRTITISGFSKTYNMTGWRLGYATGPADIIQKMALVHDLIYICPPTPLQHAVLDALSMEDSYYTEVQAEFLQKRDLMINTLTPLGFKMAIPQGSYYLMADISDTPFKDANDAVHQLMEKAKVATVPGSAFYINPENGKNLIRICYALHEDKLKQALSSIKGMMHQHTG